MRASYGVSAGLPRSIAISTELADWCFEIRGREVLPNIEVQELYRNCGMYGATKAKVHEFALAFARFAHTSNCYDKIVEN